MEIVLACHNKKCDKALIVKVNRKPENSFEIMELTSQVGWKSVVDTGQHMTFVYCSDKCASTGKFTKRAFVV